MRFAALWLAVFGMMQPTSLHLPFSGRWFVMQGGDTLNVNQHMTDRSQAYAIDFVKVAGRNDRELARTPQPTKLEDYFSWNERVLAPADSTVVSAVNELPDNPIGVKDAAHRFGNHVVLRLGDGRYAVLAHMQKGSVTVKVGDTLKAGQPIGACGNSGSSDLPHIHFHVQDASEVGTGAPSNPVFDHVTFELSGKTFVDISSPLIRGLFVWEAGAR
jgi:hypothetical protein